MDDHIQQEAQRVDEDVALAAGDFLARIKALRVERRYVSPVTLAGIIMTEVFDDSATHEAPEVAVRPTLD